MCHVCVSRLYGGGGSGSDDQLVSSAYCSYAVRLPDGAFYAEGSRPSGWFHLVVNYIGPGEDEGIRVYYNGVLVGSDTRKYVHTINDGDGKIAIGRYYNNNQWRDGSVEVDDLILFNQALTDEEIQRLSSD